MKRYFDSIIIFSDNDEAGKQMEHDILSACIGKELHTVELPADKKDAGEMTLEDIINTLTNNFDILIYFFSLFDALETGNNIYLFFEFCKDGDLGGYRTSKGGQQGYLTESEAITFFCHICNGFKSLSELKIIHRDIKP